jgi:hypothetical protein
MSRERELIANIQARRDYIENGNLTRTEALRHKRAIEAWEEELVALGGTVPPEPPRRKPSTGRYAPIYDASRRVRMESQDRATGRQANQGESVLAFHEDRGDRTPLCGQSLNDWTDPKTGIRYTSFWAQHGHGPVSCGKCANVSGEPRSYESLAEPQGDSVRTVSGGAFEMNRRRH